MCACMFVGDLGLLSFGFLCEGGSAGGGRGGAAGQPLETCMSYAGVGDGVGGTGVGTVKMPVNMDRVHDHTKRKPTPIPPPWSPGGVYCDEFAWYHPYSRIVALVYA